jgi:hypothetical protein
VLHIVLQYLKVKCRQLCIHVSDSSAGIFLDNYDKSCLHITCIYARVKCVYMIVKFIIINTRTQLIDYIHTGMVVELEASRSVVGKLR